MNNIIQLISFLFSFIFGILFYLLTIFNFYLIKDLKVLWKHILTFIYVLDITIIYIILLYKLNNGYFHIYFILMVMFGFTIALIINKKILNNFNVKKYVNKVFKN